MREEGKEVEEVKEVKDSEAERREEEESRSLASLPSAPLRAGGMTVWLRADEEFGGAGGEDSETRLAGGRAGEVQIGPDEPAADALVIGEGGVGGVDGGAGG